MRNLLIIAILAAVTGCAQTPAETAAAAQAGVATRAALEKELAGLVPGKPQACLDRFGSQQLKGFGATVIYKVSGSLKFRSDTAGGCERIARGDILVTRSYSGRLCRGDIGQTIDPVSRFPTGSCSFSDFVPYRKAS
ncbi:MAG TPA: hypothetical protein VM900_05980 [Sphingomonas sp.]|nr:hypothetical protein [Sphingomonas sp.]